MARVSNRTDPLAETLGGIAIAIVMIYAGYRVIRHRRVAGRILLVHDRISAGVRARQAPGPAEPRPQLAFWSARAFCSRSSTRPATEPADENRPALNATAAHLEFSKVNFSYRAGGAGPAEHVVRWPSPAE